MPLIANDVLACAAGTAPARLAVTLGEDRLTFGEVEVLSNRYANALHGLGARGGASGRPGGPTPRSKASGLYFALSRLGLAFVPLNPAYTEDEAAVVLAYLRPQFLIVDPEHAEPGPSSSLPGPRRSSSRSAGPGAANRAGST